MKSQRKNAIRSLASVASAKGGGQIAKCNSRMYAIFLSRIVQSETGTVRATALRRRERGKNYQRVLDNAILLREKERVFEFEEN